MFQDSTQVHAGTREELKQAPPGAEQAAAHEEAQEENLFTRLLHHTQDSHEIEFFNATVDLPYLIYDNGSFHAYKNAETMREDNTFTIVKEKVVRTSDHQPPLLDLSITKHVVFMWIAAILLIVVAVSAARKNRKS